MRPARRHVVTPAAQASIDYSTRSIKHFFYYRLGPTGKFVRILIILSLQIQPQTADECGINPAPIVFHIIALNPCGTLESKKSPSLFSLPVSLLKIL